MVLQLPKMKKWNSWRQIPKKSLECNTWMVYVT